MINLDTTVIVALVAAISAIVSPLVANHFNNRHALKIRRLELYTEKRIAVINEFVSNISKYLVNESEVLETELGASICSIYLYAPREIWPDLDALYGYIALNDRKSAKRVLPDIAKLLSESVSGSNIKKTAHDPK